MGRFECVRFMSTVKPKVFVVLFVWLACTAELNSAAESWEQEMSLLRTALAASQAEVVQLKSKIVQLQSENVRLRESDLSGNPASLMGSVAEASELHKPAVERAESAVTDVQDQPRHSMGTQLADAVAEIELEADLAADADGDDEEEDADDGEAKKKTARTIVKGLGWASPEKCSDRCNKNCWINLNLMDKTCRMTREYLQKNLQKVKFVGTSARPKWNIVERTRTLERIQGTVECPCHFSDGKPLSEEDALRSIVGQVAAMGITKSAALGALQSTGQKGRKSYPPKAAVSWNTKIALSVVKMLKCWNKKCRVGGCGEEALLAGSADNLPGRPVELQLGAGFGGGTEC